MLQLEKLLFSLGLVAGTDVIEVAVFSWLRTKVLHKSFKRATEKGSSFGGFGVATSFEGVVDAAADITLKLK